MSDEEETVVEENDFERTIPSIQEPTPDVDQEVIINSTATPPEPNKQQVSTQLYK